MRKERPAEKEQARDQAQLEQKKPHVHDAILTDEGALSAGAARMNSVSKAPWRRPMLVFFLFLAWMGAALQCASTIEPAWRLVKWIDDGDTFVLSGGERVRLIGIDAPEIAHGPDRPAEPFGGEALNFNISLLKGERVRLETGVEARDRYGRLLAHAFLKDGTHVNRELVRRGLAFCLPSPPNNTHAQELLQAQRLSMEEGAGLWRDLPEKPASLVGNVRTGRFHLKTCPHAKRISKKNRVSFDSFHAAFWSGSAPCRDCLGQWRLLP